MGALDPFEMLVRLGNITRAQLDAADLVESAVGASTRAARLVLVGVDKQLLLESLSELTRMPLAPPELLASAGPMTLPKSSIRLMKELLAVPIGRVDEHILYVAVADPRTSKKLRDAAIAHRPRLALEGDILAALARVFPQSEASDPWMDPTLKQVPLALAPRPVSVDDGVIVEEQEQEPGPELVDPVVPLPVELGGRNGSELVSATADGSAEASEEGAWASRFSTTSFRLEVTERVWRAHALADRMRESVSTRATGGAKTLAIAATIAVATSVLVLALVVFGQLEGGTATPSPAVPPLAMDAAASSAPPLSATSATSATPAIPATPTTSAAPTTSAPATPPSPPASAVEASDGEPQLKKPRRKPPRKPRKNRR